MSSQSAQNLSPVLFLPHGGGPLPILGDKRHEELVAFLKEIPGELGEPSAILVISAHWEETCPTITSGQHPQLIYDYSGFPGESYEIQYPAPGDTAIARELHGLLEAASFQTRLDDQRGFDHGMFIPLKIMYPEANIPCVQLSLLNTMDPAAHIAVGKAISEIRKKNVLIVGSGMSFHNMQAFFSPQPENQDESENFDRWIVETCCDPGISAGEREQRLSEWESAPHARYCHPREEHLLPLYVCYGAACAEAPVAKLVFNAEVLGKRVSGLLWQQIE